jgi:hypothetical protein
MPVSPPVRFAINFVVAFLLAKGATESPGQVRSEIGVRERGKSFLHPNSENSVIPSKPRDVCEQSLKTRRSAAVARNELVLSKFGDSSKLPNLPIPFIP